MSNFTQPELLYSWAGAGPTLTGTTTPTSLNPTPASWPGPKIPAQLPGVPLYRAYRLVYSGVMTTASTAVTFALRPFKGVTDGAATVGLIPALGSVGGAPAMAPAISLVGCPFLMDLHITMSGEGTGGAAVITGKLSWCTAAAGTDVEATLGNPTTVAWDTTVDQFLQMQCTLSGTTASNTIWSNMIKLFAEN